LIHANHFKRGIAALLPSAGEVEACFDRLWPICRSITGNGVRSSFAILRDIAPFELFEVPSGEKVLDWTVPKEWNIEDAYVEDEAGHRVIDFRRNNLHVLGYSMPVDRWLTLDELQPHLHSLPEQPEAIPYFTSYYKERWGFCLEDSRRQALRPGRYRAVIRATLAPGFLTYGHLLLPSTTGGTDEVLISSYLCHPSMANNELSGPLLTAYMHRAMAALPERRYNYRFVLVPETIGAITYLARHGGHLKQHCRAGLVATCCGDARAITYKRSRRGDALIDRCVEDVLEDYRRETGKAYAALDFFPSGSDERQYCSPGFNLPVGSLMRSMYTVYPEYHTSLDNKSMISFDALVESIELYLRVCVSMENNETLCSTVPYGEPMLGPRGLYPNLGGALDTKDVVKDMMYLFNYADGEHDLCAIARKAGSSILDLAQAAGPCKAAALLEIHDGSGTRKGWTL
jgi:aminopeptidase-like protein